MERFIQLKNIKTEERKRINVEPPKYLVFAFIFFMVDILSSLLGTNSVISVVGVIVLLIGLVYSTKEKNFKIMYRNFIFIFIIDTIVQVYIIFLIGPYVDKLLVTVPESIQEQIINLGYIHILLILLMMGLMFYNISTGRKREIQGYLNTKNYIIEENETSDKRVENMLSKLKYDKVISEENKSEINEL